MWQRVQTLYLLCAIVLMIVPFFASFVSFYSGADGDIIRYTLLGGETLGGEATGSLWPSVILTSINVVVCFVAILMFKTRLTQIRVVIFNIILLLLNVILCGVLLFMIKGETEGYSMSLGLVSLCPLFAVGLMWLAIRAIGADEALVRSADRLR